MSINCPHCAHTIKLKSVKAGKFQLKCTKCAGSFVLSVSGDAEPVFSVSPVVVLLSVAPMPTNASSPEVTATPNAATADNADFSVAASAVAADDNPEATTALDPTQPPPPTRGKRVAANFEVTQAEELGEEVSADEEEEPKEKPVAEGEIPSVLGGYQIIRELGRGGMGAVYLARQISLDRLVALKVMNARWAKNPAFLVRFTREAYAAAQLVHHNVIQVYDIGSDKGIQYFSMEYVEGQSLGDMVKKEGKLAPTAAAGYVLQAARGLKYAHDRGMIHRDVKPDNLMLNNQGVVKVADLGLVRTPGMADEQLPTEDGEQPKGSPKAGKGAKARQTLATLSNVTMAGQAMGTPAYMAPEQARDATKVDHRADVYSLGCTLYVLITGKPVFAGSNALEVMTRHAHEPIVRPDAVAKQVPRGLADVVVKMIAKKPDDRYQSMDEVIKAMEDFLGLEGAKTAQTEQHLRTLEQGHKAFTSVGFGRLRSFILLGFYGGCAALFALLMLVGLKWPGCLSLAACVLGLATMTGLSYFVVSGVSQKGPLFRKVRDFVLSASFFDYLKVLAGLLLFVAIVWLILPGWAFGLLFFEALLSVGLAFGLHLAIDRRVAAEQAEALVKVERMLKTLRMRGISEEAVQGFVAKYAGEHWEEFFEALFGYEAKLQARALYGQGPKGPRPKYAGWREPIIRWIDAYQKARKEARERRHLQELEQANLEAQGVAAPQAAAQAEVVAAAMMQVAADVRQALAGPPLAVTAPPPAPAATAPPSVAVTVAPQPSEQTEASPKREPPPRRVNVQDMLEMAAEPAQDAPPPRKSRFVAKTFKFFFGGGLRFLLGVALLAVSFFWLSWAGLLPGVRKVENPPAWSALWMPGQKVAPLPVPLVPTEVMEALCSLGALVAGTLLIMSALWYSWKIGFTVLLASAVMVAGPVIWALAGLPAAVWIVTPGMLCLAAGLALAFLGFMFGRDV